MDLVGRFEKYVESHSLFTRQDKILLAVSGGVDSMVMLSLFARSGYDVGVAHCNFQLRGPESEEDEVLVENESVRYGLPFYNMRFDTIAEMERTGESVQMAARRLRYAWFEELCGEHGYRVIAIAHHADDSVETFFINMLRGTGLRGLTGISSVNGRVVRPLLFATRRDILDYAGVNNVPYREDSSNSSRKYLRNKIRLGLIPRIKEINPNFTQVMCNNVQRLTDAQLFITHGIERIREEVESCGEGMITIDPSKIDPAFPLDFVAYELLSKYGFKADVVDSLIHSLAAGETGKRFYARDYMACTDRGKIVIGPIEECDECSMAVDEHTTKVYAGNSVLLFEAMDIDNIGQLSAPENVAHIDRDKLQYPLEVRRWRDGDVFMPFGMSGRKKVSDYLVDDKVSVAEKRRQFVLVNGDGHIIWLIGRRIDDAFKITGCTENVLRIVKEIV